jgi:alpha-1,3-glucan synthase
MSDLISFDGFANASAPFTAKEYDVSWKSNVTYLDFAFQNTGQKECEYPRFWNTSGQRVLKELDQNFSMLVGCYDSEFDQVSGASIRRKLPKTDRS